MARGRKLNNPDQAWLKELPEHIVKHMQSPEGQRMLDEVTHSSIKTSNTWRELRRQGVTPEYFEAQDIVDPTLMEPHELLTQAQANIKYAKAFEKVDSAKFKNSIAQRNGAENMRENAVNNHQKIIDKFRREVDKYLIEDWSATHAARIMIKQMDEPWDMVWHKNEAPSIRTLTSILRNLAKATPRKI